MKKYLAFVLVALNFLLLSFLAIISIYTNFFALSNDDIVLDNIETDETIVEKETTSQIAVEVKGAVANPGVYFFDNGAIVNDLINEAGGLDYNAYTKNINFSKKLLNEMVIYIYTNYEYNLLDNKKDNKTPICNCPEVNIEPCLDSGISVIVTKENDNNISNEPSSKDISNTLININTASVSELMSLSGIGEAKAKSIIAYREINGNFTSIEDIKNVSGISDNLYEKIKDYITI